MRRSPLPLLLLAGALSLATPARAALRSPQVPVSGAALASFFASQGQAINPSTDQQDIQQLSVGATASFEVRTFGSDALASVGLYNALAVTPALYAVHPGAATPGWFEVCAFRTGPTRLVVNLFDGLASLIGTTTYLGADPSAFGVYGTGAGGTVYQQDSRNPAGTARVLVFNGVGARAGYTWFAIETGDVNGGDFADRILLVNLSATPVDVEHVRWGELKQRFR